MFPMFSASSWDAYMSRQIHPAHVSWDLALIAMQVLRHCFNVPALLRRTLSPTTARAAVLILAAAFYLLLLRMCLRHSPLVAVPFVLV
jgi:hypothetical protein